MFTAKVCTKVLSTQLIQTEEKIVLLSAPISVCGLVCVCYCLNIEAIPPGGKLATHKTQEVNEIHKAQK